MTADATAGNGRRPGHVGAGSLGDRSFGHGGFQIERRDDIPWGAKHEPAVVAERVADAFVGIQADLIRYLRAVVGSEVAEDLASQVWVEVVAGAPGFRGDRAAFRRWVFATARRRGVDHRRRWWQRAVVLRHRGQFLRPTPSIRAIHRAFKSPERHVDRVFVKLDASATTGTPRVRTPGGR